MGTLFRSEEMALCQLFIQPETAYSSLSILGESGIAQFRDLNSNVTPFKRNFVCELRRCEELERKLRYIENEAQKDEIEVPQLTTSPIAPNPKEIAEIEVFLERVGSEVTDLSQNTVDLKSGLVDLVELRYVLRFMEIVNSEDTSATKIEDGRGQLRFIAGIILRKRMYAFERMLWRITHGNAFLRQAELEEPLEDPSTGNRDFKTVFVVFFQGENLRARVLKVCAGFRASIYSCPDSAAKRREMVDNVNCEIEDMKRVLNQTQDHRYRILAEVATNMRRWGIMVRKMKAIYHTLNMFDMDTSHKCLIGECWVPVDDLHTVRQALVDGGTSSGSTSPSFVNVIETLDEPPTFHRTNKFTAGFQNLIDMFGTATYREANPALFTIITFPFLFGVMYGDVGHGIILSVFALYMVYDEERFGVKIGDNEIWNIFFKGRYVILLSGIFSIYTGFIYNDIFSVSMNIFGSSWRVPFDRDTLVAHDHFELDPVDAYSGTPYIFGIDPIWQVSENKIKFLNSFKLKMSLTIAVLHMTFGVSLSIVNHVHFKNYAAVFLESLPKLIFVLLFIGYTVFLIFVKWIMYYSTNDPSDIQWSPQCAPSLLVTLINMVFFEHVKLSPGCKEYIFDLQPTIQLVFLLVLVLCIPVMVFGKPLIIYMTKRIAVVLSEVKTSEKEKMAEAIILEEGRTLGPNLAKPDIEEEEDFTEILIHQAIHSLEFVLSTVDNTASYLRLWALSLAHAQLSDVLWVLMMRFAFWLGPPIGGVLTFIAFGSWAFFTLAIIIVMEGVSASLHTLQLHWVEFMSKFYNGSGYPFQPLFFKNISFNLDEKTGL